MFQNRLVETGRERKGTEQNNNRAQVNQSTALRLLVRDWQGRVRESVVRRVQKDQKTLRDEINAQNQNHRQEKHPLCHELTLTLMQAQTPLYSQHELRVPGQGNFVLSHGFVDRWRLEVSYGL